MILQESAGVVVVGGAGWGTPPKLYYCLAWQVEVCYLGAVAIKPVEVVLEIFLVVGQLQKLILPRSLLCTINELIGIIIHWLIPVSRWLSFKWVNLRLVC